MIFIVEYLRKKVIIFREFILEVINGINNN